MSTVLTLSVAAALASAAAQPSGPSCWTILGHAPVAANAHTIDSEEYPRLSIIEGQQGVVLVDFAITPDGGVADARVATSSGFALLDGAAVDMVQRNWRYKPVFAGGKAVTCRQRAEVHWTLDESPEFFATAGPFVIVHPTGADYPPDALARHEEGASVIMLFVDSSGHALQEKVVQSSGYAELDQAAISAAQKGRWRITPPQVDGVPAKAMLGLVVEWSPGQ